MNAVCDIRIKTNRSCDQTIGRDNPKTVHFIFYIQLQLSFSCYFRIYHILNIPQTCVLLSYYFFTFLHGYKTKKRPIRLSASGQDTFILLTYETKLSSHTCHASLAWRYFLLCHFSASLFPAHLARLFSKRSSMDTSLSPWIILSAR